MKLSGKPNDKRALEFLKNFLVYFSIDFLSFFVFFFSLQVFANTFPFDLSNILQKFMHSLAKGLRETEGEKI